MAKQTVSAHAGGSDDVRTSLWERITAAGVAVVTVCLVLYLVLRNERITDRNLVVLLRIVLSLAVAVFGATVPGFLNVGWKGKALVVRSGGALALVVLTLFWTPTVLDNSSPADALRIVTIPPEYGASGRVLLGAEFIVKVENVPANGTLEWSQPQLGHLNVTKGNSVKYTAPASPDAVGHETLRVNVVADGRDSWQELGFEVERPSISVPLPVE